MERFKQKRELVVDLKWTETTARQEVGKTASGTIFEQQVKLDSGFCVRRITSTTRANSSWRLASHTVDEFG
jgi:hypothetical protein